MSFDYKNLADKLRTNLWFVPGLMAFGAVALAFVTIAIDSLHAPKTQILNWTYEGGPEGARQVLSSIASSMITVAGVVFSITIVVLTLASSQFGPHVLRHFLRDRSNQIVLGTFVATYLYCLIVLRTVRSEEGVIFVPHLSVSVSMVLAIMSLAVLVYFIHHVSSAIQAPNIIAEIAHQLRQEIRQSFPPGGEADLPATHSGSQLSLGRSRELRSPESGYVQSVDIPTLLKITERHNLIVEVVRHPGEFIGRDDVLACIWPEARATEEAQELLQASILIGHERTQAQDVQFSIDQLVQIALRALSPAMNDPFTANICIEHLGEAMADVARGRKPSPVHTGQDGQPRVICKQEQFANLLDASFNQIRQNGVGHISVVIRLMETLSHLAGQVTDKDSLQAVRSHIEALKRSINLSTLDAKDREDIQERIVRADTTPGGIDEPRKAA